MNRKEQPDSALVREVFEESGLRIEVEGPYKVFSESTAPMLEVVMRAHMIEGDFSPSDEVDKMLAVSKFNIPEQIKPTQREVIEEFFNAKEKNAGKG